MFLLANGLNVEANAAVSLALFHTLFNALAAVLVLPFIPQLAKLVARLFRSVEEDTAGSRHLDPTLVNTPT